MHGGVSFTPYKEQFEKLIGKPIHYLEMYNASEGFFSCPVTARAKKVCCCLPGSWNIYGVHAARRVWKETSGDHRFAGCGDGQELRHGC